MYLHEFCGSWMEHPFWRAKFVLKDPKDLERIQATAIDECGSTPPRGWMWRRGDLRFARRG
jgi:hypothetical protein